MADGGKTGSAPRYVNNLNNTEVHKGAIILRSSKETPTVQRKAAFQHIAKAATKPKENSDSLAALSGR